MHPSPNCNVYQACRILLPNHLCLLSQAPLWDAAKEFAPVKDPQDGYSFLYPFGWQEVAVKGQDIGYKDVIEPLESVSVSITQTDKADVTEFGSPAEVHPRGPQVALPAA